MSNTLNNDVCPLMSCCTVCVSLIHKNPLPKIPTNKLDGMLVYCVGKTPTETEGGFQMVLVIRGVEKDLLDCNINESISKISRLDIIAVTKVVEAPTLGAFNIFMGYKLIYVKGDVATISTFQKPAASLYFL